MVTSIDREETEAGLKPGWRMVRFGDVVSNVDINERDPLANDLERYVGLEHLDPESLHIQRWGLIEEGTSFTRKFVTGQVLFGKRRAYQHKAAVADFDGICSGDILVFEAKDDLLPELLPFIVQSDPFYEHALNTSAGSLSPRTKWKDLAAYEFALPPKDEQRRIADILWAADEAIEYQIGVKKALENCARNVTNDLVKKGLSNWAVIELGEIAEVSYGLTINGERRKLTLEKPYLRVANVMKGILDLDEIKVIGCTFEDINKFALHNGDVLVVEGHASVDEIGRAALWHGEIVGCLHQNHILRVRCKSNLIPEYFVTYLNSPLGRKYIQQHAKSSSGLNTINSTVLKQIPVPLPSLETQKSFVEVTQSFEQSIEDAKNHIASLIQLKKALLSFILASN